MEEKLVVFKNEKGEKLLGIFTLPEKKESFRQ
jgi:hypothetical protein